MAEYDLPVEDASLVDAFQQLIGSIAPEVAARILSDCDALVQEHAFLLAGGIED